MKHIVLTILALIVVVILFAYNFYNKSNQEDIKDVKNVQITAKEFVQQIDALGYFKYANEKDIQKLKQSHLESFNPDGSWGIEWDDETNLSLDYRYYFCDGESVYEQDGFTDMLKEMAPTFRKMGLTINIESHFEEWDSQNEWLNHRITLNGTEYVIFRNFKGYGWGEAVQRLAEIINAELEKQDIDEKIYLINGGNDGSLIFLNDELYQLFYQTFTDPRNKPLNPKEWAKIMEVNEMEY